MVRQEFEDDTGQLGVLSIRQGFLLSVFLLVVFSIGSFLIFYNFMAIYGTDAGPIPLVGFLVSMIILLIMVGFFTITSILGVIKLYRT